MGLVRLGLLEHKGTGRGGIYVLRRNRAINVPIVPSGTRTPKTLNKGVEPVPGKSRPKSSKLVKNRTKKTQIARKSRGRSK